MKKIVTLIAGILLLGNSIMAQGEYLNKTSQAWNLDRGSITRISMEIPSTINAVNLKGKARLLWAQDTVNHLECYFMLNDNKYKVGEPSWNGDTLILNNPYSTIYLLYVKSDNLMLTGDTIDVFRVNNINELDNLSNTLGSVTEVCSGLNNGLAMKILMNTLLTADDMESTIKGATYGRERTLAAIDSKYDEYEAKQNEGNNKSGAKKKRHYERTNFDFHWAFNNWGSTPFNGLIGMNDAGYDLRTSFSSFQLSENYSIIMREHFACGLGIGYESDVYKFNKPYVTYSNNSFSAIDTLSSDGYYSSRYVTRYVQLPFHFTYYAKSKHKGFNTTFSVIPALGFNTKHTGIKHELHQRGRNVQDQSNIGDGQNPFKLDLRMDVSFGGMAVFFQVATMPLFVEGTKIYPIKIGFKI